MQTSFTNVRQLADRLSPAPIVLTALHPLRSLLTATCPTYVLTGDERDSPRGRIYFMKQMFEDREVTASMTYHIDRCLSCFSCMTTCPSGVDYMHLVDLARTRIEMKGHHTPRQRFLRMILSKVLPHPRRFRLALMLGRLARPFRGLVARAGLERPAAALALVPPGMLNAKLTKPRSEIGKDPKAKRVALMLGCVQEVLAPSISRAAIRLLRRHGVDVVVVEGTRPAAARFLSSGKEEEARGYARRNIDAWTAVIREKLFDAILITTSWLRHHGQGRRPSPGSRPRLCRTRGLYLRDRPRHHRVHRPDRTCSADDVDRVPHRLPRPCSLQHGQKLDALPLSLLEQARFQHPSDSRGSSLLRVGRHLQSARARTAGQSRERKLANIAKVKPDVIVTANIGCMMQLKGGTSAPFVHTVEMLDWADGRPCARGAWPAQGRRASDRGPGGAGRGKPPS